MYTINFWSGTMAVGTLPIDTYFGNGQFCEAKKV